MIILAKQGNLLEEFKNYNIDCITNASNALGILGAGIAGAIREYGGLEIQQEAISMCRNYKVIRGGAFTTKSGKLKDSGIKNIIHAVTMNNPGSLTSYGIIKSSFISAIKLAEQLNLTRVGCTALGTGVGRLDSVLVAKIMSTVAKSCKLEIIFIDFDKKFIDNLK